MVYFSFRSWTVGGGVAQKSPRITVSPTGDRLWTAQPCRLTVGVSQLSKSDSQTQSRWWLTLCNNFKDKIGLHHISLKLNLQRLRMFFSFPNGDFQTQSQCGDYHWDTNFKDKIGLYNISLKPNLRILKHRLKMTGNPAIFISLFSRFLSGSIDISWFKWRVFLAVQESSIIVVKYQCQYLTMIITDILFLWRKIREHLSGL